VVVVSLPLTTNAQQEGLSPLAVLTEVSSCYTNVGVSYGRSTANHHEEVRYLALCSIFPAFAKILIVFLELVGNHRNLPSAVDKSISVRCGMVVCRVLCGGLELLFVADVSPIRGGQVY
jgi:Trk-type K+ transport system membrane component